MLKVRLLLVIFTIITIINNVTAPRIFIEIKNEKIQTLSQEYFKKYKDTSEIILIALTYCKIENVDADAFQIFPKLKEINLSNNLIKDVKFAVNSLHYLFLWNNLLTTAPPLQNFPKLKRMNLDNNNISIINDHSRTNNLKMLQISENPLKVLNITLGNLVEIIIKNSKYSMLEVSIDAPSLKVLQTSQTLIKNINAVCTNKNATIITDFNNKHEIHYCAGKSRGKIITEKNTKTTIDTSTRDTTTRDTTTRDTTTRDTTTRDTTTRDTTTKDTTTTATTLVDMTVMDTNTIDTTKMDLTTTARPLPENAYSTTKILIILVTCFVIIIASIIYCKLKKDKPERKDSPDIEIASLMKNDLKETCSQNLSS